MKEGFLEQGSLLERSVAFAMGVTSRKMGLLLTQRLKSYDITPEQWLVLYCVQEQDGMIQKEIAARTDKDKPSTTRILDSLDSKGFIEKQAGENDRRSFLVFATEKGRSLIAETDAIERNTVADAMKGISEQDQKHLMELLRKIMGNIDGLTERIGV